MSVGMYREGTLLTCFDYGTNDGRGSAYSRQGLVRHHEAIGGLAVKHSFFLGMAHSWNQSMESVSSLACIARLLTRV